MFYGKTGRGKTHLATALGMLAIEQGRSVRFRQTAELVLQPGKAKRDGALDSLLGDLARADLIILDECFASIFLKQFLHYFSAVWAAGFQQELHHMTAQTRTGTGPPCLYIPET